MAIEQKVKWLDAHQRWLRDLEKEALAEIYKLGRFSSQGNSQPPQRDYRKISRGDEIPEE